MLIVVNLTLGCWLLEFISVFVMLLLLLLDAQVKVHAFDLLCFFSETGCASSGYKFDSCGILKETSEKLFFLLILSFDSGLNFSGWWW